MDTNVECTRVEYALTENRSERKVFFAFGTCFQRIVLRAESFGQQVAEHKIFRAVEPPVSLIQERGSSGAQYLPSGSGTLLSKAPYSRLPASIDVHVATGR